MKKDSKIDRRQFLSRISFFSVGALTSLQSFDPFMLRNFGFDYHTEDWLFEQKIKTGFDRAFRLVILKNPGVKKDIYLSRLEYEMSVIKEMGYTNHFLFAADYINYAKQNNILVGPGRGRAPSSIVAYSLGLTDIDPIEHDLIFERFIDPEWKIPPFIMTDFCISGREKVLEYLNHKYGKDYVSRALNDENGSVSFEFQGLYHLTVIRQTLSLIRKKGCVPPDISNLDLTDKDTYRLLSSGNTTGVFMFEDACEKELLIRSKPNCFSDLIALFSLNRPGPIDIGMLDDFLDRKNGQKPIDYIVPALKPILGETYGLLVYFEQIMKIANSLAGYSMAKANNLWKTIGRRIPVQLAKERKQFLQGAIARGITYQNAKNIFDLFLNYGGYTFPQDHSVAYTLIAFQTAYLKAHFEKEFMVSLRQTCC